MKKILALVLALVMTLSLATISSGAAFSDADKVQYVDAVNTLNALGVLNGYADGSIVPQGDVTRGAAAKMVAMVATGSNPTAIGYYKGTSSFADVPAGHVFADAVAFCVARGIVAGYGDGNYGLTDNVKGWAVAKMVLVAMGYDAAAYGMEGAGSALNTITLASQVGLFAGMKADFAATEAASREECAQIVYNALNKEGVVKAPVNNNGVVAFGGSGTCLLENYGIDVNLAGKESTVSALDQNVGVVTANQDTGAQYTKIGGTDYAVETGKELIGHKVMFVANGAYDAKGKPCVFEVVDLSYEVAVAEDITSSTVKAEEKFHAVFGEAAIDITGFSKYSNYAVTTSSAVKSNFSTDNHTANAGTYVLYTDSTGATSLVSYMVTSSDVVVLTVKVDNATKGYYTVFADANNNATVDSGETVYVKVAELATDCKNLITSDAAIDWLAMVATGTSSAKAAYIGTPCGSKLAVEEIATVEGKVTQKSDVDGLYDDGTVYVDGVKYGYQDTDTAAAAVLQATAISDSALPGFTATYTFYLDEFGQIFAYVAKTAEDTNSYELAYITGTKDVANGVDAYGTTTYDYNVQYYKLDGSVNMAAFVSKDGKTVVGSNPWSESSKVLYSAAKITSGTWALVANVEGGVAVKSLNTSTYTNGYKLESYSASALELKATTTTLNSDYITNASAFLYSAASGVSAANDVATVKTGAHANVVGTKTLSVVVKESANVGKQDVVAVWVPAAFAGTAVTADFVYVVSYNGEIGVAADGFTPLYQYTVIDKNGVEGTATYTTAYDAAYVGTYRELITDTAAGTVALKTSGTYATTISEDLKGADVYDIDGVKYAKKTAEYVVTNAKVIDLRSAVAAGTAEAVTTVADAALLSSGSVTAIYTKDQVTEVMTIGTIIVK